MVKIIIFILSNEITKYVLKKQKKMALCEVKVPKYVAKHIIVEDVACLWRRVSDVKLVAYGIDECPKSVFDGREQVFAVFGILLWQENRYAPLVALYVQLGWHHHRLAVDVHDVGAWAAYGKLGSAERLYVGVLVEVLGE